MYRVVNVEAVFIKSYAITSSLAVASVFLTLNISTFSIFGVLVVVAPSAGAKILATRVSVPSPPSITSVLSSESLTVNVNVSSPVPPVNAS